MPPFSCTVFIRQTSWPPLTHIHIPRSTGGSAPYLPVAMVNGGVRTPLMMVYSLYSHTMLNSSSEVFELALIGLSGTGLLISVNQLRVYGWTLK